MTFGVEYNPADWAGVEDPWEGVVVDFVALHVIVSQVFRIPTAQCGPPVAIGPQRDGQYAHAYSFQLPSQTVVARLVAPVKPLFKTESEVAAMDFVRSHTSLPIPTVFAYCSEADNPVGVEWLIMEHVPGMEMSEAWKGLNLTQKKKLALDIVDMYDQLSQLKAGGIGSVYHSTSILDDSALLARSSISAISKTKCYSRSPRWAPLSPESIRLLKALHTYPIVNGYSLGPLNEISLLQYYLVVPSPSQTQPTFTSEDYFKLVAFNGDPCNRSDYDLPTREKLVELFHRVFNLYPTSTLFGPSSDASKFCFSHADLHAGNIFIDPETGSITGIIDWEAASFRPMWAVVTGVGWFEEGKQRFIHKGDDPLNFVDDTHNDAGLRAFFRTELHRRNPDLFSCFLGGIELRAILTAAVDDPPPAGEAEYFLCQYHDLGYWKSHQRGPFPWDMHAWLHKRLDFDDIEMKRVADAKKVEGGTLNPVNNASTLNLTFPELSLESISQECRDSYALEQ